MKSRFEAIFKTSNPARDKFIARLFGVFSEEVVLNWCACHTALYENLGRPTLWLTGERMSTLDFTLRRRDTGEIFIVEMKCWLEYQHYRYLRLENITQLQKIKNSAFQEFLRLAKDPATFEVRVKRRPLSALVSGAILIWGATSDEGRTSAIAEYNFADVLSVESMLDDLQVWAPLQWAERINELRNWSDELFTHLT